MSAREFERWKAFHRKHPLPDPYWIGAQICQVIHNGNRGKGTKPAKVEDFIPKVQTRRATLDRRQSTEEVKAIVRGAGAKPSLS